MSIKSRNRIQMANPFWGLASFQILAMFRRGLFYTFLSIYIRNFLGLSVTATTLYATIPMILSVIGQNFIWGPLSDRFQKRRTFIVVGEFVAGVLLSVLWYIHTLPESKFVAGYIIIGGLTFIELFWSMSNIGWSALISDLYKSKKRSKIMGWLNSIGGIGRIIGATSGAYLYDLNETLYAGWGFEKGALFFVASGIMFVSIIPMMLTPEGGKLQNSESSTDDDQVLQIDPQLTKKIYIIFIIALVFINFGRNSIATIQSQYLTLETGYAVGAKTLGRIANARSIAVISFGLIVGYVAKKIGEDNTLLFGSIFAVSSLLIFAIPVPLPTIYGASVGLGLGELMIYAASYTYASKLIPFKKRARLFAVYNATFFLSWGLSGTVIVAPLVDLLLNRGFSEVFSYQMGFIMAVSITFIGLIIFVGLMIFTHKKKVRKIIVDLF